MARRTTQRAGLLSYKADQRLAGDSFEYEYGFDPEWGELVEVQYELAQEMVEAVLAEYGDCTVRQVYYVGARRRWWEKDYRTKDGKEKRNSYQRVSRWLTRMRDDGTIPYSRVLEYARTISEPRTFGTAEEYAVYTSKAFVFDCWRHQPTYVEVWVEGEAIAPVVKKALAGWQVPLLMNRGHTSTTSLYKSAKRLEERFDRYCDVHGLQYAEAPAGAVTVLYVGDHDAAGTCMDVNLVDRLSRHIPAHIDVGVVEFRRIAITREQIAEYDIEPDPKPVSTRGTGKLYIERFGTRDAWAFEALPPDVAQKIIQDEVDALMDVGAWNRGVALENAVSAKLAGGGAIVG
jgi:hypothetical protein